MATPPVRLELRKEDFSTDGISSQEDLEKLLRPLINHTVTTATALTGALTFGQNFNAEVKDVNVTVPASTWLTPTLTNGWVNFGSGFETAQYRKDANGLVTIKGLVKTGSALPSAVFTLPAGYRPAESVRRATSANGGGADIFNSLSVLTTGEVQFTSGAAAGSSNCSLDCSFYCADFSPGVLSCFPMKVSTKVVNPQGVLLLKATDTTSAPVAPSPGNLAWTLLSASEFQITNIPGLLPGKTYSLRLLVIGG